MKLDIACGKRKQEGYHGVDISPDCDADTIHDLNIYPWPFEDESVDEAHASHYVEHIPFDVDGQDGLIAFMNEVGRILKPGGKIRIQHPYMGGVRAFQDPTHRRFIPQETWSYFDQDWLAGQLLDHYPITCDFKIVNSHWEGLHPNFEGRTDEVQQFALTHYWNIVGDLVIDLEKK